MPTITGTISGHYAIREDISPVNTGPTFMRNSGTITAGSAWGHIGPQITMDVSGSGVDVYWTLPFSSRAY